MEEWRYGQRWEMQHIINGIYIGPYSAAKQLSLLQSEQITDILIVRDIGEVTFIKPYFPTNFKYEIIDCKNSQFENLIQKFPIVSKYIHQVVQNQGRILIHCVGGISRAPCFVIAYLMEYLEMSFEQAYQTVQNKRFCINPVEGFFGQLKVSLFD
jgi:serine/threonine/tyrosine-interacting protein